MSRDQEMQRVAELSRQRLPNRRIAEQTGINVNTIARWVRGIGKVYVEAVGWTQKDINRARNANADERDRQLRLNGRRVAARMRKAFPFENGIGNIGHGLHRQEEMNARGKTDAVR